MNVKDKAKAIIDELPEDTLKLAIKRLEDLKTNHTNPFRNVIGIIENGNLTKAIDKELYG